jgi:hypothetical protein
MIVNYKRKDAHVNCNRRILSMLSALVTYSAYCRRAIPATLRQLSSTKYIQVRSSSITTLDIYGPAIAQTVSRRLLTATARVRAQSGNVGFVVDKMALGNVFLRVLQFPLPSIIPAKSPSS